MPQIVAKRNCLGQFLIQPQRDCKRLCNLVDLKRVRQARAVMVALRRQKHLCFMHQPAKRLAMDDPVAVACKRRADRAFLLRAGASARMLRQAGVLRQALRLQGLRLFADGHSAPPSPRFLPF